MERSEILEAAKKCVCGDREQDYGTPEDNFGLIADLWSVYTGHNFTPVDVAMMMAIGKCYASQADAAKDIGDCQSNVSRSCRSGGKLSVKGQKFVFAACGGELETSHEP